MPRLAADRHRIAVLCAAYAALVGIAFLGYYVEHIHVGALAVIPILFISYYVRPISALATAFAAGIVLGLLDQPIGAGRVFDAPPLVDATILSLALCTVVLVANRLRETSTTNELLRGVLVKARRAADHDALTGIVNRRYFMRYLGETISRRADGERAALLFCDLDRFKYVNDTDGHQAGDEVLRMASSRLVNAVRAVDVVARIGGDEFAVLAQRVDDADEAVHMARNIEKAFDEPFHAGVHRYNVGITVGIALLPDDGTDPESLMHIADARMYRAKQSKRVARDSV